MVKHEIKWDFFVTDQSGNSTGFAQKLRSLFHVMGRCDPNLSHKMRGFHDEGEPDYSINRGNYPLHLNENSSQAARFVVGGSERTPIILGSLDYDFEDPQGRHWEFTKDGTKFAYQANKSNQGRGNFVYTVGGIVVPDLGWIQDGKGPIEGLPKLQEVLAHSGKRDLIEHLESTREVAPIEFLVQGEDLNQVTREADISLYEGLGNNAKLFGLKPYDKSKGRSMCIDAHKKYIWGKE